MCLVDQLSCGSVLTPAFSCTKFKILSGQADSPMAKIGFFLYGGPVFASQTKKLRKGMCLVDQLRCGSVLTPAISCTKFKVHSAHGDSPMAKIGFVCLFLGRTSLCFTDQEPREEDVLGGPTPLWGSTYTSYLLYKVQDPFSACRQSHGQNRLFVFFFLARTSLCFTDKETQEENVLAGTTLLWVSAYTGYLLYKVQDPFSACRQSHCQKSFFVFL